MISKLLLTILLSITILNAYTFEEYQSDCKNTGIQKGYSSYKDTAKAIEEATKEATIELAKVFSGVVVNSLMKSKTIDTQNNDEFNMEKVIEDYTSEQASGNIFRKRIKAYKNNTKEYRRNSDGLLEVSVEMVCSQKMYNKIQDSLQDKMIEKLELDKKKVCVVANHDTKLNKLIISQINEYLLSNHKKVFKLYDCNEFKNNQALKENGFTTILNIAISNEKIHLENGSYQLFTKLNSRFKNLSTNELFGEINDEVSSFNHSGREDIINKHYEQNTKQLVKQNIKKLLIQLMSENKAIMPQDTYKPQIQKHLVSDMSRVKYYNKLLSQLSTKTIDLIVGDYKNHKATDILKSELTAKGILFNISIVPQNIETIVIDSIKEKHNKFWEIEYHEYSVNYHIIYGSTETPDTQNFTIKQNPSPYSLYLRIFLIFIILSLLYRMHDFFKNRPNFKTLFITYGPALLIIFALIQGYFFPGAI
ncbi:MAG: hypothetical protein U9N59_06590 [Campylobacterota bacterium]|nr:hypothetical protein [Campylobacterota bacterium]